MAKPRALAALGLTTRRMLGEVTQGADIRVEDGRICRIAWQWGDGAAAVRWRLSAGPPARWGEPTTLTACMVEVIDEPGEAVGSAAVDADPLVRGMDDLPLLRDRNR